MYLIAGRNMKLIFFFFFSLVLNQGKVKAMCLYLALSL